MYISGHETDRLKVKLKGVDVTHHRQCMQPNCSQTLANLVGQSVFFLFFLSS